MKRSRIIIEIESDIRPITIHDMGEFQDATEFVERLLHDAIAEFVHARCIEDDEGDMTNHVAAKLLDDAEIKIDEIGELGNVQLRYSHATMKVTNAMRKFRGKPKPKKKKK